MRCHDAGRLRSRLARIVLPLRAGVQTKTQRRSQQVGLTEAARRGSRNPLRRAPSSMCRNDLELAEVEAMLREGAAPRCAGEHAADRSGRAARRSSPAPGRGRPGTCRRSRGDPGILRAMPRTRRNVSPMAGRNRAFHSWTLPAIRPRPEAAPSSSASGRGSATRIIHHEGTLTKSISLCLLRLSHPPNGLEHRRSANYCSHFFILPWPCRLTAEMR